MKEFEKLKGNELLCYEKILLAQDIGKMFEFGVVIGRAQVSKEALDLFEPKKPSKLL